MMDKTKLTGGDEPIRTGRSIGERKPAGKTYAVDPKAVARLRAYLVAQEEQRGDTDRSLKRDILADILRRQHERQAEINARRRKPEIAAELAREWHISYYQAGFSVKDVAEWAGVGRNRLTQRWKELGLPVARKVEERAWEPDDEEDASEE